MAVGKRAVVLVLRRRSRRERAGGLRRVAGEEPRGRLKPWPGRLGCARRFLWPSGERAHRHELLRGGRRGREAGDVIQAPRHMCARDRAPSRKRRPKGLTLVASGSKRGLPQEGDPVPRRPRLDAVESNLALARKDRDRQLKLWKASTPTAQNVDNALGAALCLKAGCDARAVL